MGTRSPHMTLTRKARHSNKNRPASRRGPSLPCATPTTTTPEAHPHHAPHRDRSTSGARSVQFSPANPTSRRARRARERKPHATPQSHRRTADPQQHNRSRHGLRPISTRNRTDLAAEGDHSTSGARSTRFSPANPTSRRARRARGRRPHAAPRHRRRAADPRQHDRYRAWAREHWSMG